MGGAVAARPVHPECPDASSGCIEGPAQPSVWGGADASIGDRVARTLRYATAKPPALLSGLRVPLKAAHRLGFPPSSARPCCGRRSPGMGGAVAARPVHPECPDASSGCIEGPRTAQCLGRGRRQYWRQSCARPSIRVGQSTGTTQRVAGAPQSGPPSWIPSFVGTTLLRSSKSWYGWGRCRTTRSPRVPRRFVGVYRGAPHSPVFGAGPTRVLATEFRAPSIRVGQSTGATQGQRVGSIPDSLRDRPGVRPLDNNRTGVLFYPRDNHRRRPNYPLSTTHYPLWNTPVPFCSALFHLRYDTWNTWCSIFRQSVPSPR